MKVRDIMAKEVAVCAPETNIGVAMEKMWKGDVGVLPVLDGDGRLTGILTDRDIAIALATRNARAGDTRVDAVATAEVFSCSPDDEVHGALKTMRKHKVRRLPIIDNAGALVGMVSVNDVILHSDHVLKRNGLSYEDVVNTLKGISEHRPQDINAPAQAAVLAAAG